MQKGAPYSWVVITRNAETQDSASSEEWLFYNAGSRTTHPPFPAQPVSPLSGSTVTPDLNNEVGLEWSGADVDIDIEGYDVYLSTETPPIDLASVSPIRSTNLKVTVSASSVYYWRVVTTDSEGNSSDSGIFSFKVN
jgi:hypothetical protein